MKDIVITYNDNKKITIADSGNIVRYGLKKGVFFIEMEDGEFVYFPLTNVIGV